MRVLLGLCLVLLLGGCNRVHSDHPLFFADASADAPRLRDGLWVIDNGDSADCRYDARKPVTRWPGCADWMLVRGGEVLGYDPPGKGDVTGVGEWTSLSVVLSAGDPPVLQIGMTGDGKVDYQFFGIEPTAGGGGAITAFASWPVMCGPPPPGGAMEGGKRRFVTLEPLPGLTVIDESSCTAADAAAVRNAAGPSRAWAGKEAGGARWVRDGYP
ncbi:MAG: hypothetical protein WC068_03870 [Caulobacter sp.]